MEPGTRLGHYEILEPLGAGGMGEVYRARDTKLDRDVAIKVLPEDFASDPDRLARFEREAKLLAALNHANIGAIHGLEESDGVRFLVLELIEGQTLEQRLMLGALPVPEALGIARQIAEALEAAHDEGIIHRDVKPANVLLTAKGGVKVLDFGIAKNTMLDANVAATAQVTNLTMDGTLMGTPPYMSPEQIRGEEADKRADIWAFGCVMYEMLAGRGAFTRETVADTLAAVLDAEPDWEAIPGSTPPEVGSLLRKCMRKDTNRRLRDIGDARIEIEEAFSGGTDAVPAMLASAAPVETTRGISWKLGVPIAVSIAVVAALTGSWLAPRGSGGSLPQRFHIDLPEGMRLPAGRGPNIAISPDGQNIAYVASGPVSQQLYLRRMSQPGSTLIPGTEEANNPTFSPDGKSLAFRVGAILKKVSLAGGEPFELCSPCGEASWGDAGDLIFVREGSLWSVPEVGGTPELVAGPMPDRGVPYFSRPLVLPGGKAVLIEPGVIGANAGAAVISLESKEVVVVATDGSDPFYSNTGHVVFARGDTLFAVPFDLDRLRVTGEPVPVVQGVRVEGGGALHAAVSRNGVLVYAPGAAVGGASLFLVDRSGATEPLTKEQRAYTSPRISPDGESIAVHVADAAGGDIWILEIKPGTLSRLTTTTDARDPVWTRDGLQVTYLRDTPGARSVESTLADGSGSPTTLLDVGAGPVTHPESWTPDDGRLVIQVENDLMVLTVAEDSSPTPFLETEFQTRSASVSHDGNWVAYVSDISGSQEVYVRRFPGGGAEYLVSNDGGKSPVWSSDDSELFYKGSNRLVAVSVRKEPEWEILGREPLFDLSFFEYMPDPSRAHYDVFPDGQRFMMLSYRGAMQDTPRINVVLNWFEELKQRVPTGR